MPFSSNTWQVLTAIQQMILTELLVQDSNSPSTPALPLSPLLTADATRYGVAHAAFIGVPKDWRAGVYARQLHIVTMPENVAWRTNPKVWDYAPIYLRLAYSREADWYTAYQDIVKARDVMYKVLLRHAEGTGQAAAPTVQASQIEPGGAGGAPIGYHLDLTQDVEWDCWGFMWRIKQEWTVSGGLVP